MVVVTNCDCGRCFRIAVLHVGASASGQGDEVASEAEDAELGSGQGSGAEDPDNSDD